MRNAYSDARETTALCSVFSGVTGSFADIEIYRGGILPECGALREQRPIQSDTGRYKVAHKKTQLCRNFAGDAYTLRTGR